MSDQEPAGLKPNQSTRRDFLRRIVLDTSLIVASLIPSHTAGENNKPKINRVVPPVAPTSPQPNSEPALKNPDRVDRNSTQVILPVAEQSNPSPIPTKTETFQDYVWRGYDENGKQKLSRLIKAQEAKLDEIGLTDKKIKEYETNYEKDVETWLKNAAFALDFECTDLDIKLFHCLVLAESQGNPRALSDAKAYGLGQIMKIGALDSLRQIARKVKQKPEQCINLWSMAFDVAPKLATRFDKLSSINPDKILMEDIVADRLFDPEINITLSAIQYFDLKKKFDSDRALIAYNLGQGNMFESDNSLIDKLDKFYVRPPHRPTQIDLIEFGHNLKHNTDPNAEQNIYVSRIYALMRRKYGPDKLPLAA